MTTSVAVFAMVEAIGSEMTSAYVCFTNKFI